MAMNKVPTLLVGLGGIGCSIADMIYPLLDEEAREYVAVVGMDTNTEDLAKLKIPSICTSDERKVREFLLDYPEYREWFPVNQFLLGRGMLSGAGQVRAISRMAGLASIEANRYVTMLEEIKRILMHTGDKDISMVNVFFVGSITGGTGAGLFLQTPFYVKQLFKQECGITNVRIRGMFMSADITKNEQPSDINRDAVMVNAYACIKELNAFYLTQNQKNQADLLNIEYYEKVDRAKLEENIKKKLVRANNRSEYGVELFEEMFEEELMEDIENMTASEGDNIPYDAFYLIEGTDNKGTTGNSSIDTVKQQIARMVYTMLFTPMKAEETGTLDNTILQDMEGGGMARYSSAGMCTLKYPYESMREYVTLSWSEELINREWLLLDKAYEIEKSEAQARQKSDPSVKIPKLDETFVRLFERESEGGEGRRLGQFRRQAFVKGESYSEPEVCRTIPFMKGIENSIKALLEKDEIQAVFEECKIDMKKMHKPELAQDETVRVYGAVENLQKVLANLIVDNRVSIANDVFPVSMESMEMKKENSLCIYGLFSKCHPIVARYLAYKLLLEINKKITELEAKLASVDLSDYKKEDFYGTEEDGIQDATTALILLQENKKFGMKKSLKRLVGKFFQNIEPQVDLLEEHAVDSMVMSNYVTIKERLEKLCENYESFFGNLETSIKQNKTRMETLQRSYSRDVYAMKYVCAAPEMFTMMYSEFLKKAKFELPEQVQKNIFNGIFKEVCVVLKDKGIILSSIQKRKRDEAIKARINELFETGVVNTIRDLVSTQGSGVIDLSIKQAIEKEIQYKFAISPEYTEDYEKQRIAYEKELVETALTMAAPMFAVTGEKDITETIYIALHPDSAEIEEGKASKAATKNALVPQKNKATDMHAVGIIMEPEFSKYEIICMKGKHKYMVENLVKYSETSEFAKKYRERINNLGKKPVMDDQDAYKTVVNPHLHRYWHEEGVIPPLGAEAQGRLRKDLLKAFVYGMAFDCFEPGILSTTGQDKLQTAKEFELFDSVKVDQKERKIWNFVCGNYALPVTKLGELVGSGYSKLFDSLAFNRKIRLYVLALAEQMSKKSKGFLDAEDTINKLLTEDVLVKGLARTDKTNKNGKNILDIILSMHANMPLDTWQTLFEGLNLVLFEYLACLFDRNAVLVNVAYRKILYKVYSSSETGVKDSAIKKGTVTEPFTKEEQKLKDQVEYLLKQKYM